MSQYYCTKCGTELVLKVTEARYDRFTGEKTYDVKAICPKLNSSILIYIFKFDHTDININYKVTEKEVKKLQETKEWW